jgi:hypothetical protein
VVETPSGYLHRSYAESFNEVAAVRELPRCGGWVLERAIPESDRLDAMGCYPLFACRNWSMLPEDLSELAGRLVSVTFVTDPFGEFKADDLRRFFDVVVPYKQHYIADLRCSADLPTTRSHRRNASRALRAVQVHRVGEPSSLGETWCELYEYLVATHRISGLRAFSSRCLHRQLTVPGLRMFSATAGGDIVGLHLWYVQGDVAYGHLGATSAKGYELMASYALYAFAFEQLRAEVRWLALGSSAGAPGAEAGSGLRQFKAGWATGTRETYLCGRILQPDAYCRLADDRQALTSGYFPAYRCGELTIGTADRAPEDPHRGS